MTYQQYPTWAWRVAGDEDEDWEDLPDQKWFDWHDAAREACEQFYSSCGGASDWEPEENVLIEVRSPNGSISKHNIWWEPDVRYRSQLVRDLPPTAAEVQS